MNCDVTLYQRFIRGTSCNCSSVFLFTQIKITFCTINSKINGTPKGFNLPISKLHSNLAVVNLIAHNNLWLCYHIGIYIYIYIYIYIWAGKFATAKI